MHNRDVGLLQEELFERIDRVVEVGLNVDEVYDLTNQFFTLKDISVIPGTIPVTINVNEVVYHDMPKGLILESGDVLTVDICFSLDGELIDGAVTYLVGVRGDGVGDMIRFNKSLLKDVIANIQEGTVVKEILRDISDRVAMQGYHLVSDGMGHGVGSALHESPFLSLNDFSDFNYVLKRDDKFTLEPILLYHKDDLVESEDGVGYISKTNCSSQFEVTIVIGEKGEAVVLNKALLK